jgi:hypothetical protein
VEGSDHDQFELHSPGIRLNRLRKVRRETPRSGYPVIKRYLNLLSPEYRSGFVLLHQPDLLFATLKVEPEDCSRKT